MILSCQNIEKAFLEKQVLKNCSFHIEDYEKAAIVGLNGAGKTTLLRIIVGQLEPDGGVVAFAKDKTFAGDRGAAVLCGRLSGCAELYAASGSDEPWNSGDGLCFLKRSEKAGRKPWTAGCCNDSGSL